MTKIRQEAAGSGTGTIALRAPVTNETRNLEYPDRSGTFALIDGATGAPAMADGVPVVESGSNSDGDWTKFGDGSLILRLITTRILNISLASGTSYRSTGSFDWDLPTTIQPDSGTFSGYCARDGSSGIMPVWFAGDNSGVYTNRVSAYLMSPENRGSESRRLFLSVLARWK